MLPPRPQDEQRFLAALALALIDRPRSTMQELATAIGVGKTTLYRFSPTREQITDKLIRYTSEALGNAIDRAQLDSAPPRQALRALTENFIVHRELAAFFMYYWKDSEASEGVDYCHEAVLDAFFLRGQQAGILRIDVSAAALTEIWFSVTGGLIEAERRGRVAQSGLAALIDSVFMQGTAAR